MRTSLPCASPTETLHHLLSDHVRHLNTTQQRYHGRRGAVKRRPVSRDLPNELHPVAQSILDRDQIPIPPDSPPLGRTRVSFSPHFPKRASTRTQFLHLQQSAVCNLLCPMGANEPRKQPLPSSAANLRSPNGICDWHAESRIGPAGHFRGARPFLGLEVMVR
jgi:hypothetical protein